ncbi:MAG: alpha/beta hydrolase [Pirellulaceae bacterium]
MAGSELAAQDARSGELVQQFLAAPGSNVVAAPHDQIWIVSSRSMGECEVSDRFDVGVYDGCKFLPSTLEHLKAEVAANSHIQNVVHVHGNFTDYGWSIERGFSVYRNGIAGVPNRHPVRFIIWSWSSERAAIPLRDFKIKTERSVVEGYRLSQFFQSAGVSDSILIGYSMGAQAALTSLADLHRAQPGLKQWKLLLIAPAIAPEFCNDQGNPAFDQSVSMATILTNQSDRALKNARRVYRLRHQEAIDQFGLASSLSLSPEKLQVFETSSEVGPRHRILLYCQSDTFQNTLKNMLYSFAVTQ